MVVFLIGVEVGKVLFSFNRQPQAYVRTGHPLKAAYACD